MSGSNDDRGNPTEMRSAVPDDDVIHAGTTIGHYRIETVLGSGGMGTVYRATDVRLKRPVAIKFLSAGLLDAAARARFQREAQTASALNHPHILTVYDVGELDGRQFIVTELVDGGTLADWAERLRGRRDWRRVVDLLIGVGDGLATAHEAGILHRDVKPANVLVSKGGHAKLADFGLAKSVDDGARGAGHTAAGVAIGTVAYMSPEQAAGNRLDARSDVFAFGVLLYELLEGRGPFPGRTDLEVMQSILHAAPRPLSDDSPEALRAIVDKALEKDVAERYQTMRDLVVDLKRVLRKSSDSRPNASAAPAAPRKRRAWAGVAATLILAAAVVAGAAAWLRGPTTGTVAANQKIAILPFENLSPDLDNAYFTDGLHDEILKTLANVAPDLDVVSRTTMMLYRAAPKPVTEIAAELGATYVLSGSVRREGNEVRLSLELVDARSDRVLWGPSYNRTLSSALTLQSEVAEQVARQLSARVLDTALLAAARTTDPEAYDLFLKATLAQQGLNFSVPVEAWSEVERLLDGAIMRDPLFVRAYVARSQLHMRLYNGRYDASELRLDSARRDAETARRLAPGDPAAIAAQALLAPTEEQAIALFEAAERAGLKDPDLLLSKAGALVRAGRRTAGVELMTELASLDPGNASIAVQLHGNLVVLREPERALATLAAIEARTSNPFLWSSLRAVTIFSFTGNTEPLVSLSGAAYFRDVQQGSGQDLGDALRNNVDRLVLQERYAEARDLVDSVSLDAFRVPAFGGPIVETPTADFRGWTSLLLRDSAAAAAAGDRVLEFLDRTPETPTNAWYRRSLRADARVFRGEHAAAAAEARAMLDLTGAAEERSGLRAGGKTLAARSLAWAGEADAAVELLRQLAVDEPGLPPADIARQPMYWVPLRGHEGFDTLVEQLEAQMSATRLD